MRKVNIEVRIGGLRLPKVIREIVDRIRADDWERRSTKDGSRFYYVIGKEAAEISGQRAGFEVSDFPGAKATVVPKPPGPYAEHYIRSQTADKHPNYVARAKRKLMEHGPSEETIDRFIKGDPKRGLDLLVKELRMGHEAISALIEFLEAYNLPKTAGKLSDPDADEASEIDIGREKLYLQRACETYERMVNRGSQFDPISFVDPQLHEAANCFLAGRLRATVLLSASALEQHLTESGCVKGEKTYKEWVHAAFLQGKIGKDLESPAKDIFTMRNNVAHDNYSPDDDETSGILGAARTIVDDVLSRRR